MRKKDFLDQLDHHLKDLDVDDRKEVMYDYEEHFEIGLSQGKSEEEICIGLGSPEEIAKQYTANVFIKKAEKNTTIKNTTRALLATIGLGFFNIVFVLGPFVGCLGILIGLMATSFAISLSGGISFISFLAYPLSSPYMQVPDFLVSTFTARIGVCLISLGLLSLGIIFILLIYKLSKFFLSLVVKYLKLNMDIIKG